MIPNTVGFKPKTSQHPKAYKLTTEKVAGQYLHLHEKIFEKKKHRIHVSMVYLPLMWANIPYGSCGKQVISQKNTCHNIFQTRNLRPSVLGSGIASSSWGAGSVPQPRFHWMNVNGFNKNSTQLPRQVYLVG